MPIVFFGHLHPKKTFFIGLKKLKYSSKIQKLLTRISHFLSRAAECTSIFREYASLIHRRGNYWAYFTVFINRLSISIIGPWMIYLSGKNIFRRKHPKYDDFIIIGEFPKKCSIDSSFRSEKFFLAGNTLYIDFDPKKFSTEILKNA